LWASASTHRSRRSSPNGAYARSLECAGNQPAGGYARAWRRSGSLLSGDLDGQPFAALLATARQNLAAAAGGHARAAAVGAAGPGVVGLVRALHGNLLYIAGRGSPPSLRGEFC